MSKVVILDMELSPAKAKKVMFDGKVMTPYRLVMEVDEVAEEATTRTYMWEGGYEYKEHIIEQTEKCDAETAKLAASAFKASM